MFVNLEVDLEIPEAVKSSRPLYDMGSSISIVHFHKFPRTLERFPVNQVWFAAYLRGIRDSKMNTSTHLGANCVSLNVHIVGS